MPAPMVGIPGGSGMQTQVMIQQLIEIERKPLMRLEEENKRNQIRIQAWEELRNRARVLSNLSRDLYSFSGPFTVRTIVSSDPGAITGSTSPDVEEVSQSIQVLALATYHQIHSRQIQDSEDLPAATFRINTGNKDIEVKFQGGKFPALERLLRQHAGNDFEVSSVRITSDRSLLTLRSKNIGVAGAFQFTDPDGLLRNLEIVGETKQQKTATEALALKDRTAPVTVAKAETLLPVLVEGTTVSKLYFSSAFKVTKTDVPDGQTVTSGPDVREQIGGVELNAPDIERRRQTREEKALQGALQAEVIVIYDHMGARKELKMELRGDGDQSVDIAAAAGGPAKLLEIRVIPVPASEGELKDFRVDTMREEEGLFGPKHETTPAKDTRLLVNGVEVTRPRNEGITDLIKGASLNFHRVTESAVHLKVQHQSDEIKKKIKEWVEAHNALVQFVRENDKFGSKDEFQMNRPTDPNAGIDEGLRKLEDASGIFAGDAVTRRLIAQLQSAVAQSYPTRQQPAFRVIGDIGISTGAVGSDWKDIQKGLLVIDDAKLDDALGRHPESVRELFAADGNEDGVTDNGIAYAINRDLAPYVTVSGGVIASRIDLLQEQIKSNKKQIYNKELSLKQKEQQLREKFGRMETQMRQNRSTSEYLKNRLSPGQ